MRRGVFFRTVINLLLATLAGYMAALFVMLFTRDGGEFFTEWFTLTLEEHSGGPFLRVMLGVAFLFGVSFLLHRMSVSREIKSEYLNFLGYRAYSYREERERWWREEAVCVLIACFLFAILTPAFLRLSDPAFSLLFVAVKFAVAFGTVRLSAAFYRYAWARERMCGLSGRPDL